MGVVRGCRSWQDFELRFDVGGLGGVGSTFASVSPCEGKEVHGMLYQFSDADYTAMLRCVCPN